MPTLRFGVFDDFKGAERKLLLWGDASAIGALQSVFHVLAKNPQREVVLNDMAWAEAVHGTHLTIRFARSRWEPAVALVAIPSGAVVTWSGTDEEFSIYADLLDPLANASSANGHQYLDSKRQSPLQIMVSKEEYPDDMI